MSKGIEYHKSVLEVEWDEDRRRAVVYPLGKVEGTRIDITKRAKFGAKEPGPAEINWQAIGSQDRPTTKLFVEGLLKAIEIAEEMDKGR